MAYNPNYFFDRGLPDLNLPDIGEDDPNRPRNSRNYGYNTFATAGREGEAYDIQHGRTGLNTRVVGSDFQQFIPGFEGLGPFDPMAFLGQFGGPGGFAGGSAARGGNALLASIFGMDSLQLPDDIRQRIMGGLPSFDARNDELFSRYSDAVGEGNPFINQLLSIVGDGRSGGAGYAYSGPAGGGGGSKLQMPDVEYEDLPPFMKELIESQTDAAVAKLKLESRDREGRMLSRLFDTGLRQSSMSADAAGRFNYGEQELLLDAIARGDDRVLELIVNDRNMRNALAQTLLQANASITNTNTSAAASRAASAASSRSAARNANIQALLGIINANTGALSSGFGDLMGAGASGFGDYMSALTNSGTAELSALLQAGGLANDAVGNYNDAYLGSRNLGLQQMLGLLGLDLDNYRRIQEGTLGLGALDQQYMGNLFNYNLGQDQLAFQRENRPSLFDRLLGAAASGVAGYFQGGFGAAGSG